MLTPKVSPQIHNLPRAQPDQHSHTPHRKPLHPLIRTLVRIPQPHLPLPQVLHLPDHLLHLLLDPPDLRLHRFQPLLGRHLAPVARVRADVHVELDLTRQRCGAAGGGRAERVGEAHVEGGVGVRRECEARFADDVSGPAVFVADGVFDLWRWEIFPSAAVSW